MPFPEFVCEIAEELWACTISKELESPPLLYRAGVEERDVVHQVMLVRYRVDLVAVAFAPSTGASEAVWSLLVALDPSDPANC